MGTYMYVHVEQRDGDGWKFVPCKETREQPLRYCVDDFYQLEWYRSQNYHTMAVLADVRNYDNIPPISCRRFLPDDLSDGLREVIKDRVDDPELGSSWLLLSEIKSYDFDRTIQLWSVPWTDSNGVIHRSNESDRNTVWHNGVPTRYGHERGYKTLEEQGHPPVQVPIREEVEDLLLLVKRIENSLPGVSPQDIRLTLYISW